LESNISKPSSGNLIKLAKLFDVSVEDLLNNNDSFSTIAGYDENIEYNYHEVKKLLIQIDLHIGVMSAVYVFLLCAINCMGLEIGWINILLMYLYMLNFVGSIVINNYKTIDKIYCKEEDKKRAKRSLPITIVYTLLLFIGIGIIALVFEANGYVYRECKIKCVSYR